MGQSTIKIIKAMRLQYFAICITILSIASACKKSNEMAYNNVMSVNVEKPIIDSVLLRKTYPGSLSAKTEVNLVARVNGYLQQANYRAGDYIKKGQLLFIIEPEPFKEAVTQAEAQLASAKSQKTYAQINYESTKDAAQTNAVSQIDLAQAENNLEVAIASVKSAESALETARTNLEYCYIRAPFNGHITNKSVDVGNYLNGGTSPQVLATIYDDRTMTVTFTIEDSQYMRMVSEQKATGNKKIYNTVDITFNEYLPHKYTGEIGYLSPMVDLSTGTITLQAKIDNRFSELKSGMYCIVSLPYKKLNKAILIKDAAIGTDQLGKYIYTVNDSNKVVYTPIKIGDLANDTMRIVTEGLNPDQKYIIEAIQKVRDGMSVNPILKK